MDEMLLCNYAADIIYLTRQKIKLQSNLVLADIMEYIKYTNIDNFFTWELENNTKDMEY